MHPHGPLAVPVLHSALCLLCFLQCHRLGAAEILASAHRRTSANKSRLGNDRKMVASACLLLSYGAVRPHLMSLGPAVALICLLQLGHPFSICNQLP